MKSFALAVIVACSAAVANPGSLPAETGRKPQRTAQELQAEARKELDAIGVKIDDLDRRARAEGAQSRERLEAQVRKLRDKKSEAEELLNKLAGDAAEAGKDVRSDLNRAIRDLKRACRSVRRTLDGSRKNQASPPKGP